MQAEQLKKLFEEVKNGTVDIDEAVEKLRHLPFEDLGFACVDHHRQIRRGFPEVIYCPNKTTEQIIKIFGSLAAKGNNVLATRAEEHVFEALSRTNKFPQARYEKLARAIVLEQKELEGPETVLPIVTAGTADLPVAEEARVTAEIMGQRTEMVCDVGVAGLHRLFGHLPKLQNANVIIVVAGMEGALASVMGGLVSCPVIAVPTSVGYGSSFEGLSALLTMLNSCAAGVSVVNIDGGFSAAVIATLINRKIETNK
ncbi:MAG: nickel pincer cofactor biosynthesis protein LarB [Phycisphaerae bacterium]|nr:nickel pincer cofactor biosynthesis protein LarB [Phycisphaerae bacterium]NIP51890.1 nickel pincer cofactor biosynthesis protein LarB [Phycisphaerae bacterium]NIS49891.1 nickel pincer cofactor biosynthesis protein LarB [Phycisphaerae bacterium]NIU08796.1 nickel pincer cofactor biosynthesis protein LarB [Phycisphaerae bacterium]NIU56406.1 nickel pincer cofactor biosynthesis protein LarB [Phycisphaerae bacterium]